MHALGKCFLLNNIIETIEYKKKFEKSVKLSQLYLVGKQC